MPNPQDKIRLAYNTVRQEMPDVGPISVAPSYNMISRFGHGVDARANSDNSIEYDPNHVDSMVQNDVDNMMAHELTHVRQNQNTPWYQKIYNSVMGTPTVNAPSSFPKSSPMSNPYAWQPNEMEALQTERDRQLRQSYPVDRVTGRTDMYLPEEKGVNTAPSDKMIQSLAGNKRGT